MPKRLTETTPLSEAGTTTPMGRMRVRAISAGVGSSGYYSPEVLEQAAEAELITKGTHLYLDHPTDAEEHERPGRSVRDIAAVFTESAAYDAETQSLVGEIQIMAPYRDLLEDLAPHIGLSIRGSATDIVEGEVDGQKVRVIEGLHSIDSVDFVTKAGRGGQVIEILESADANRRALRHHGISEATVNDTREALQTILRDAYGAAEKVWVYVRDFDDSTVWFEVEGTDAGDNAGTYGQDYTQADDGAVTLTGTRTEVRVQTTYVPVARPGSTTTTEESEEDTMPKIQIEEAEHKRLVDEAGRVKTLESERDTAVAERDTARGDLAAERRQTRAMDLVREHEHAFTPLEARGLVVDLPLTESGEFDETKFGEVLTEHAAKAAKAKGAGAVSGFGATSDAGTTTTESERPARSAWGREVKGA